MTHLRRGTPTESCLTGLGSHRSRTIWKHARHWREIAYISIHDAEQREDGGLVGRDGIEVAHLPQFAPATCKNGLSAGVLKSYCGGGKGTWSLQTAGSWAAIQLPPLHWSPRGPPRQMMEP
jgi:hypothetical protein